MIYKLKGFQSETPEANLPGASIALDGSIINLIDFQQFDYLTRENVGTALARTHRYCGNSLMTVAQHCHRGAEAFLLMGEIELAWIFMHHEDAEAIGLGDVTGPVKALLGEHLKKYENEIERRICEHLGIEYPFPPDIKLMDKNLAQDEMTMMAHRIQFDYWVDVVAYRNYMQMIEKLKLYRSKYK